ncbi:MAG TPA: chlorite dismutase family protein [Candidatus Limnocylindrales bacterium]|nr:chlorite dismutase family protein [Candidatus Limnocylindrales bacterium]
MTSGTNGTNGTNSANGHGPAAAAGDTAAAETGSSLFVQALALGLEPAWRRRDDSERGHEAEAFREALAQGAEDGVGGATYSSIGLEPDVDLLLWRTASSVDALETSAARLLRSGLGRWLIARHSFIGRIRQSQYVRKPTSQEQSVFSGERSRYLVVYPFTKSTEWYLTPAAERQRIMNGHMKVGHRYPAIRQALAYSFGLDSQDFIVAYETDDLSSFGELVYELRGTESRIATVSDTPILLGVHRPIEEILDLLGAPSLAAASR